MADKRLIAAILAGAMTPSAALVAPEPKSEYYNPKEMMRASVIGDLAIHAYQMLLTVLMSDDEKIDKETAMSKPELPANDAELAELAAMGPSTVDEEIIAAIITAGMLPTLRVPKLHRVARNWRDQDLQPMAEVVASSLTMYRALLGTMRLAAGKLTEDEADNLTIKEPT